MITCSLIWSLCIWITGSRNMTWGMMYNLGLHAAVVFIWGLFLLLFPFFLSRLESCCSSSWVKISLCPYVFFPLVFVVFPIDILNCFPLPPCLPPWRLDYSRQQGSLLCDPTWNPKTKIEANSMFFSSCRAFPSSRFKKHNHLSPTNFDMIYYYYYQKEMWHV